MIKRIYIKNFAIIEESEFFLDKGFNVLTGETGSGKSLIFQAINFALGKRASTDYIRNGESKCIIEVEFEIKDSAKLMKYIADKIGDECKGTLIFRKELNSNGLSRSFLNDSAIQLNELKLIASKLLDHHGQLQTTNLLNSDYQLELLDELSDNLEILDSYKIEYDNFSKLINKLKNLYSDAEKFKKDRDYWEFQLKEIQMVNPKENEDILLEEELKILENAEELIQLSDGVISDLYENEINSYLLLNNAIKLLKNIDNIDNKFTDVINDLESAKISIDEAFRTINNYKNNIEFNPDKIEELRIRYLELKKLIKKYGSIEVSLKEKSDLEEKLNLIDNFDEEISKVKREIENQREKLARTALSLSGKRKANSKILSKELNNQMKEIGLEQSTFDIKIENIELDTKSDYYINIDNKKISFSETGIDKIEFYISTNIGESQKPLSEIASGGEMSRIMLAIKSLSREKSDIDTLLLDEIDTGISGRIAQKVGKYMKKISENIQILTITHLPQIAANADNHFLIEKFETANRTFSKVKLLDNNQSLEEIAKLFSGEELTETSIESAKQLVGQL